MGPERDEVLGEADRAGGGGREREVVGGLRLGGGGGGFVLVGIEEVGVGPRAGGEGRDRPGEGRDRPVDAVLPAEMERDMDLSPWGLKPEGFKDCVTFTLERGTGGLKPKPTNTKQLISYNSISGDVIPMQL